MDETPSQSLQDEPENLDAGIAKVESTENVSMERDRGFSFVDHFSLQKPSSFLRFRGNNVQIYDLPNSQFVLEEETAQMNEDGNSKPTTRITAKSYATTPFSLHLLRVTYTLTALLMVMFFFVVCFNIVLSLFLNIPSLSGVTTGGSVKTLELIGAFLAMPLLVCGMANLMAFGTAFVADVWKGGPLLRSTIGLSTVWSEWAFFALFVMVPTITIAITLFGNMDNWWSVSAKVWMLCIFIGFFFFWIAVAAREISLCFALLRISLKENDDNTTIEEVSTWNLMLRSIYLANLQRFDGTVEERYIVSGKDEPECGYALSPVHAPVSTYQSTYSRLISTPSCTQVKCSPFNQLDSYKRVYGVNEILDILPFETSQNWSLQSGCCADRSRNARKVTAANGTAAVGERRMMHMVYCVAIGILLLAFLIVSFVVYMDKTLFAGLIAIIIIFFCFIPITADARYQHGLYKQWQDIDIEEHTDDDLDNTNIGNTAVFQIWESYRIIEPKEWYCYFRFGVDIFFLFLWPFIMFFAAGNWKMAILFLFVGLLPLIRYYLDPFVALREMGPLKDLDLFSANARTATHDAVSSPVRNRHFETNKGDDESRVFKHRISEIVGSISHTKSIRRWVWVFIIAIVGVFFIVVSATEDEEVTPNNRPELFFVEDFVYEGKPHLSYPSCEIGKSDKFSDAMKGLPDYALYSALTYEWKNVTESVFEQWFGPNIVVDQEELVMQYRKDKGNSNVPVWFKLFTYPSHPGTGLVAIRGSETNWDWMVNVQLWASSGLASTIRLIMPFGWLWDPILDDLVATVDTMVSHNIEEVSYYKVVTEFVNHLYDVEGFTDLRVTGTSLGGGMAIIVGAQTKANAIAISGPSAVLNRHTLDPPVTLEDLDEKTFDTIPGRDIIANIGGRSRLYQQLECTAPMNSLLGCHSMFRSLCELSYSCGTEGHAVFCRCHNDFGYPKPKSIGNRTFEEACPVIEN